jgi:hypothetical protein
VHEVDRYGRALAVGKIPSTATAAATELQISVATRNRYRTNMDILLLPGCPLQHRRADDRP